MNEAGSIQELIDRGWEIHTYESSVMPNSAYYLVKLISPDSKVYDGRAKRFERAVEYAYKAASCAQ
jgi:hypothetical protein